MYKTGMTVQYTAPDGKVKTGEYVKDTPSGRAVVMVDGRKTLPPKKILRQVKKKEEPKKTVRIDIYDKSSKYPIERIDNIPASAAGDAKKFYDKIKSWIEDKGYVFTKDQLDKLKNVSAVALGEFGIDIKPSKGKTDMLIISMAEGGKSGYGSKLASIRVKKKKESVKKKASGNTTAGQLLDLPLDISAKIGKAVKEERKLDYYEITRKDGTIEAHEQMRDMVKRFKPDGRKSIWSNFDKWLEGVSGGNAGKTVILTKAKAKIIKKKYPLLTVKAMGEEEYFKSDDYKSNF